VWKDVDGVLTCDPRIEKGARAVNELTFEEATELAYFGAQVLHPQAMQPAIRSGKLNVRVKNSYNRWAGWLAGWLAGRGRRGELPQGCCRCCCLGCNLVLEKGRGGRGAMCYAMLQTNTQVLP
jgi:hypothetical protein